MISKTRIQKKQEHELQKILLKLNQTARKNDLHGKTSLKTNYQEFAQSWPVSSYSDYTSYIERVKKGESDVLWPGRTNLFAVSAGTTGEGKHLPIYAERLSSDYRYLRRVVKKAIRMIGILPFLFGNRLSLPGGITFQDGHILGEISGILALFAPKVASWKQLCDPSELAKLSWKEKYEQVVEQGVSNSVTAFTGVPTWIPQLLDEIAERSGKPIHEQWPEVKICITGGASFKNYESLLRSRFPESTRFLECYGASEGYYAIQKGDEPGELQLQIDNGLFFELIPQHNIEEKFSDTEVMAVPLWKAQIGKKYELVVTNNSGLVRYRSGDVVKMTGNNTLQITGRVHNVLDIAGERVQLREIEQILENKLKCEHLLITTLVGSALSRLGIVIVGSEQSKLGINILDNELQKLNRHYQIRRETDSFELPEIIYCTRSQIISAAISIKQQSQVKLPSVINNPELGKKWFEEIRVRIDL